MDKMVIFNLLFFHDIDNPYNYNIFDHVLCKLDNYFLRLFNKLQFIINSNTITQLSPLMIFDYYVKWCNSHILLNS